jgi:multiple sugar transport system permease protein
VVVPYAFVLPAMIIVGVILAFPVLYGIYRSLFQTRLGMPETFAGIDNYVAVIGEPGFWHSVTRSLIFVCGCVVLGQVLGIAFALALNHATRGLRFLRGLSITPYIVSSIGAAVLFRMVFNADFGIPARLLDLLGLEPVSPLGSPGLAMVVVVIAQVWTDLPLSLLIILGGLQTIEPSLVDAARVDGAGWWQRARFVTLPNVTPQLFLSAVFLSYHSLTGLGVILGLTGGGPGNATETLSIGLYRKAFEEFNHGEALALVSVVLLLNGVLTLVYLRITRDRAGA